MFRTGGAIATETRAWVADMTTIMTDIRALTVSLPAPPVLIRGLREILPLATIMTGGTGPDITARVEIPEAIALSTGNQTVTDTAGHALTSDNTDSVTGRFTVDQNVTGTNGQHPLVHHAPTTGTTPDAGMRAPNGGRRTGHPLRCLGLHLASIETVTRDDASMSMFPRRPNRLQLTGGSTFKKTRNPRRMGPNCNSAVGTRYT